MEKNHTTSQEKINFINTKVSGSRWENITLNDWQKSIAERALDGTKINKIWIVHNRHVGATYFCKLLHWLRPDMHSTYICSHNLYWSKYISKQMCIRVTDFCKTNVVLGVNWCKPMTIKKICKDVEEYHQMVEGIHHLKYGISKPYIPHNSELGCLYDGEFNPKTYSVLNSFNFGLLTISIHTDDLELAEPYIEADKNKDNVIICVDDNLPEIKLNISEEL